jgi:NTE family protein
VLSALASSAGWDARSADLVMGTSVGAITASSLRAGMPPADLLHRHLREPLSPQGQALLDRVRHDARVLPAPAVRRLAPASPDLLRSIARTLRPVHPGRIAAAALPEGRVSTAGIESSVDELCAHAWPDEPLWLTALRLSDGELVVFGRDDAAARPPIGAAVAASCAIPGYFTPVTISGERYVDGGTTSICNAGAFAGHGLDVVVVSAPMAIHAGVRWSADTPVRRVLRRQVDREVARLRAEGTRVFVFAPVAADLAAMGGNPMAPGREPEVARVVHASALARIAADAALREALALSS